MNYSTPGFPVLRYLLESAQIQVHCVDDAIQPSHPLLLAPHLLLPSILPSTRVFSNESALCIRWSKDLEPQLQHQYFQGIFSSSVKARKPEELKT